MSFTGRDADIPRLTTGLSLLPGKTFRAICLCFSRYKAVDPGPFANLLAVLAQTQCSSLTISGCIVDKQLHVLPRTFVTWGLTSLTLDSDLSYPNYKTILLAVAPSLERLELMPFMGLRLSSQAWEHLLDDIHFPRLSSLNIRDDIPLSFLLNFLSLCPTISVIGVTATSDSKKFSCSTRKFDLRSLSAISGSPSYILAILRSASNSMFLTRLTLQARCIPKSSIVHEVLQCLITCQSLDILEICLPSESGINILVDNALIPQEIAFLNIKKFRIILDDVYSHIDDMDIIVSISIFQLTYLTQFSVDRIQGVAIFFSHHSVHRI